MATSEPHSTNPDDYPRDVFLEDYTYLGEDSNGFHHHGDRRTATVIVCDDDGTEVRDGWYLRLNPSEIDHVQVDDGFKWASGLEQWADHVAEVRGWSNRALTTRPGLIRTLDGVHGGQR